MICASCGGEIHVKEKCCKCGITYDEMIGAIRHDEIIRLMEKIDQLISSHESFNIEESLLACELINSHFLIPAETKDECLFIGATQTPDGKSYILLYTDKDQYDKSKYDLNPITNPFKEILYLLTGNYDGFIINLNTHGCILSMNYLKDYFGDDIDV